MIISPSISVRLALVLGLLIPLGAQAWQGNGSDPVEISIIDTRGRQFTQHPLREAGASNAYRAYLEAKQGEPYAILVRNRSRERLGIVIAVDGRNIISGKPSQLTSNERMYVLEPRQQAIYEGWRTGKDQVNRFYFTAAEDSYAGAWNDYTAMGIIAAAVYAEATPYRPWQPYGYKNDERDRSTQQKRSFPGGPEFFAQPGTGFGEEEWSPAQRVEFKPEREPLARYVYKYEWRETLCRRGIAHCPWPERRGWEGRDEYGSWKRQDDNYGYAPYPPGYRWNRR